MPPLVTFSLRWLVPERDGWRYFCEKPDCSDVSFFQASVFPMLFYAFWQVAYFIKVEWLSAKKVAEKKYETSFTWLTTDGKGKELMETRGRVYTLAYFMAYQLVYTIVTMSPCLLWLRHMWLHALFLLGIFLLATWNGGSFYVEVFSRRYHADLEKRSAEMHLLSEKVQTAPQARGSRTNSLSSTAQSSDTANVAGKTKKTE